MIIITNSDILGRNIRFLRESQGMTRLELAQRLNWDDLLLAELEEDIVREIDSHILSDLCDLFHRDMDELLKESCK